MDKIHSKFSGSVALMCNADVFSPVGQNNSTLNAQELENKTPQTRSRILVTTIETVRPNG